MCLGGKQLAAAGSVIVTGNSITEGQSCWRPQAVIYKLDGVNFNSRLESNRRHPAFG